MMKTNDLYDPKFWFKAPTKQIHELLEDFEAIGTRAEIVLARSYGEWYSLRKNLQASIVASTLRLSSVDYARKAYCEQSTDEEPEADDSEAQCYCRAYRAAKEHMEKSIGRLVTQGRPGL